MKNLLSLLIYLSFVQAFGQNMVSQVQGQLEVNQISDQTINGNVFTGNNFNQLENNDGNEQLAVNNANKEVNRGNQIPVNHNPMQNNIQVNQTIGINFTENVQGNSQQAPGLIGNYQPIKISSGSNRGSSGKTHSVGKKKSGFFYKIGKAFKKAFAHKGGRKHHTSRCARWN